MEKQGRNYLLPAAMILIGALGCLPARIAARLPILKNLIGGTFSWVLWVVGLAGVILLFFKEDAVPEENAGGSFLKKYGVEILILLLTAACLAMLVPSGYYWDDAVNSTNYLAERNDSVSTLSHVLNFMRSYLRLGRVNVLSFYYYFFFYIDDPAVYKALIILFILANQLIFRKTLLEFGLPIRYARLGMLIIPLMLQTRVYQDPVSGFYGLMQVLTAEMLLTALFTLRWCRTGKGRDLALGLIFFGLGLFTYEVCYPFIAMLCLLIWSRRGNFLKAVKSSLPYLALTVIALAAVFAARTGSVHDKSYAGVAFSLDPARILHAAGCQITAGLPLSFYSAGKEGAVLGNVYPAASFMNYTFADFAGAVGIRDIVILLGFLLCAALIRRDKAEFAAWYKDRDLLILGFSFALLPSLTIALSNRYQGQLYPGLGYLPVYMQYFGVACLILWVGMKLGRFAWARALGISAFCVITLLNLQNNRAVTDIMDRAFYYPRQAGESALRGGMLDFLPEDAVLVSDNSRDYLWETNWNNVGLYEEFYGNNSRHMPASVGDYSLLRDAVEAAGAPDADGNVTIEPENVWFISYDGGPDSGYAKLGHVVSASVNAETLEPTNVVTDRMLFFSSGNYPESAGVKYTDVDGVYCSETGDELRRVRVTDSGALYELDPETRVNFDSVTVSRWD
jgi:hypothetical protein